MNAIRQWGPFGLVIVGGLWGCAPAKENLKAGELGNGTFEFLCMDPSDAQCDEGEQISESAFNSIVLNGRFGITYLNENGTDVNAEIQPAADSRIDYDSAADRWIAKKAGYVGIIAMVGGKADDLVHATVVTPTDVVISQRDISGHFTGNFGGINIDITVQSDITLRVAPTDAGHNVLAGALPCVWTSENESVAEITSSSTDNVINVHPVASGTAVLQVQLGDLTGQTTIAVGG